ncbi:MAG TPA: COX15/CtaA family protein [Ktedonobacterales bacterium]|nr:COX15/CtaA family protein [Ktedonobacterales bacterium]
MQKATSKATTTKKAAPKTTNGFIKPATANGAKSGSASTGSNGKARNGANAVAAPPPRQSVQEPESRALRLSRLAAKWLSAITAAGMFIVLLMGTLVTNTGSQAGCGNDWPLCRGQLIPEFALATAIEFSHRAVVGLESILVLGMAVSILLYWRARLHIALFTPAPAALRRFFGLSEATSGAGYQIFNGAYSALSPFVALGKAYRRSRIETRVLLPLMILFLLAQAMLGALAVMYPESPEVLALHFGVSLLSFVTIVLPAIFVFDENGWDTLRDRLVTPGFRWLTWGLTAFTYIVVYLGAYVRHTGSELGCIDWPLCNGQVFPGFSGPAGAVFIHRLGALILTAGVVWLFSWAWRLRAARPDLYWASLAALVFVLAQALDGAFVVYSRLDIFSTLSHSAFVALLFGALSYMTLHVLPRPQAARVKTTSKRILSGRAAAHA